METMNEKLFFMKGKFSTGSKTAMITLPVSANDEKEAEQKFRDSVDSQMKNGHLPKGQLVSVTFESKAGEVIQELRSIIEKKKCKKKKTNEQMTGFRFSILVEGDDEEVADEEARDLAGAISDGEEDWDEIEEIDMEEFGDEEDVDEDLTTDIKGVLGRVGSLEGIFNTFCKSNKVPSSFCSSMIKAQKEFEGKIRTILVNVENELV